MANVGANDNDARQYGLRSPRHPADGTFDIVPIIEETAAGNPTYEQLPSWAYPGVTLAHYVGAANRLKRAHADPDLAACTYGDVLRWAEPSNGVLKRANRSANLQLIRPGDQLWFLARLWNYADDSWGESNQYLVGYLVAEVPPIVIPLGASAAETASLIQRNGQDVADRIRTSANYRRLAAGSREEAIFIVGDRARSCRFRAALRVDPEVARLLYGADQYEMGTDRYYRNGRLLTNRSNPGPRTFATFSSVTRSIQPFLEAPGDNLFIDELRSRAATCGCIAIPAASVPPHA